MFLSDRPASSPVFAVSGSAHRRLFWIDVLRGLAIFIVLFAHVRSIPGFQLEPKSLVFVLYQTGWMGVDLFFVISGYLIGGLVFREIREHGRIRPGRFFLRRALRIFPVYYFILFLILLGPESAGVDGRVFLPFWVYLQNYGFHFTHINFFHSWSLCVEEHFYLVFPLICLGLGRFKKIEWFPVVALAVVPVALGLRFFHAYTDDTFDFIYYTHARMEGIALGCLIAYLSVFHPERIKHFVERRRRLLLWGSLLLIVPAWSIPLANPFMHTIGISLVAFAFAGFVLLAGSAREPGRKAYVALWPLARLGVFSYTLYLVHPMLFQVSYLKIFSVLPFQILVGLFSLIVSVNTAMLLAYIILGIVFAVALAYLIEKPFLWARNRWIVSGAS